MDPIRIAGAGAAPAAAAAIPPGVKKKPGGFQDLLEQRIQGSGQVTFSKHAEHRMQLRQVSLSNNDRARLYLAVDRAAGKGARESLVLLDRMAFVVNVPNRTVVTAMPSESAREGIFTNIDSAVLA